MRLEARPEVSRTMQIAAPFAAIAFTLVVCSLLVAWAGVPVGGAYLLLLEGAAGSGFAVSETLTRATPLILTGLAVAVAFRAKLYNIGAEGQLYVGALAAVAVGNAGLPLPPLVLFPLVAARSDGRGRAAAHRPGAAQDAVPHRRGGHDAAAQLHRALVRVDAARRTDEGSRRAMGWPQSVAIPAELELGKLAERSRVHSGLLIALCARGARLDHRPLHRFRLRDACGRRQCARRRVRRNAGAGGRGQDRAPVRRTGRSRGVHRGRRARRIRDARHVAGIRLQRHRHRDARAVESDRRRGGRHLRRGHSGRAPTA